MEELQLIYAKLLKDTSMHFVRYMHERINWKAQMIGLVGPRGVGKTTLLRQHIRLTQEENISLYVSADWLYFGNHTFVELAGQMVKRGLQKLYIDEIHRYKNWSEELKQIYDIYPELQVVFTGSSVLDIYRGVSDLSRRASMYEMQGMSFREYLLVKYEVVAPTLSIDDILAHRTDIPSLPHPLPYFEQYLHEGYYPYSQEDDFKMHLMQVVQQTLEIDIPAYTDMSLSVSHKLSRLLGIVAESVPFKPNMSKLATLIDSSRNYIGDYLLLMERTGLIMQLHESKTGLRELGKVDKIYLDNTNLAYMLQQQPNTGNLRETFFCNQVRMCGKVMSAEQGDFLVNDLIFEVGGRGKKQKQIEGLKNAYIVKDDIENGIHNILPLWAFGLLY